MQRILTPAVVLLFGGVLHAQTTPIYNTIPAPLPVSLINQSFQAQRISEFGNQVAFGGTSRQLTSVTVAMVTLGYFSKYNSPGAPNAGGWNYPITLNLYSVNSDGSPGSVIESVTQSFFIPWRPEPTLACGGPLYRGADSVCHNGMAFDAIFDFSSLSPPLILPNQVIFGIAYNTQGAGQTPTGVDGPYNDLNVGLNAINTVGSNPIAPEAYLNGTIGASYADGGTGGVGVFRRDVGDKYPNIATEFDVLAPPPTLITVTGGGTQSAPVGTLFGNLLQAKVTDTGGNASAGVTVIFSGPVSGASATPSPTSATTDSSGVASVTATANGTAGAYAVTARVAGVTTPATFNLTNLAGSAQAIAFVQQPTDAHAGSPIFPAVTVSLKDANSNPIVGMAVTLSLPGAIEVAGATATTDTTGIATFLDLAIQQAGTYQLQASGGGLPSVSSASFTISPALGAGAALSITPLSGGGQTTVVGATYSSPLKALLQDAFMNPIPGAAVTFAAPPPGGASVSFGSSATVMTDVNGIATSPTMTANGQVGAFQVTASTTGAAASATFSLTNVVGPANELAFIQQPTNTAGGAMITPPVTVQVEDSFGNAVQTVNIPVTLQVNPVVARMLTPLSFAAQLTDANGLATFPSLSISQVGQYQFVAESSGIASATSNTFNIHAGTASTITATAGTPQSAIIQTAYGEPLQARSQTRQASR